MVTTTRALVLTATVGLAACCPPETKSTGDGGAASAPRSNQDVLAEMKAKCTGPNVFRTKPAWDIQVEGDKTGKYTGDPEYWECVPETKHAAHVFKFLNRPKHLVTKRSPWFAKLRDYCDRYENAKNEIKKNEVLSEYDAYVKTVGVGSFELAWASVSGIDAPRGGGSATVTFNLHKFTMQQRYSPSDPEWTTVSELEKGADVLISATDVKLKGGGAGPGHVCPSEYQGKITRVVTDKEPKR